MFGRKNRDSKKTVHFDFRRDFFVAEDGTLHSEIPLVTGTAVELEVRYVLAWILRHFADQLGAQVQANEPRRNDQVVDVAFESDLQSGST